VIDGISFSRCGQRPTTFETQLMHHIPADNALSLLAARLLADHGPQEGTRLFCVVLDELRGVKLSVPRREMFFARLWKTERDALIQQLASRPGGDFTQADLAQMFGLSKPRISQLLGSPLNGKSC
jgi:hypothetical protein